MPYNILVPWSFALTYEMDCCFFKFNLQVMLSNRYHYPLGSTFLSCRCRVLYKDIGLWNSGSSVCTNHLVFLLKHTPPDLISRGSEDPLVVVELGICTFNRLPVLLFWHLWTTFLRSTAREVNGLHSSSCMMAGATVSVLTLLSDLRCHQVHISPKCYSLLTP